MFASLSIPRCFRNNLQVNSAFDINIRNLSISMAFLRGVIIKSYSRFCFNNLARKYAQRNLCQSSQNQCGYSSVNGRDKKNEDRFSCMKFNSNVNYFAVFDGHCGDFVSNVVNKEFPRILAEEIATLQLSTNIDFEENGEKLLRSAFEKCQMYLKNSICSQSFSMKTKESLGSTALVALIVNESKLLVAHVGDSRAILCRLGKPMCLTDDHTPDNEEEVNRIEKSGGWIDWDTKMLPYVNGLLSMTRSLGNLGLQKSGISHEPYVFQMNLNDDTDEFLIMCSDGISNWITDADMISLASQCETIQESADTLTTCAQQFGSTDDATAIVIKLGAWKRTQHSESKPSTMFLRATVSKRY